MIYLILLSTNFRDTSAFSTDDDNDIFNPTMARAAIAAYKANGVGNPDFDGVYKFAAIIEADGLEAAYRATNNVDGSEGWAHRSLSVGDAVLKLDDKYDYVSAFVVDSFGFCELAGA